MRRAALLLVCLLAGGAEPQAEPPWWALVPDSYDGDIFSGRAYAKGATEFRRDGDGLAGTYAFVEPDGTQIDGTLGHCRSVAAFNLACDWSDRYGSGTVLFVFDDGLQTFAGLWFSPQVPRQGMPWTGRRRLGS